MIETLRRGVCTLLVIGCLLCFVLLAGSGSPSYFFGMIVLGVLANVVYPRRRNRNRRK